MYARTYIIYIYIYTPSICPPLLLLTRILESDYSGKLRHKTLSCDRPTDRPTEAKLKYLFSKGSKLFCKDWIGSPPIGCINILLYMIHVYIYIYM